MKLFQTSNFIILVSLFIISCESNSISNIEKRVDENLISGKIYFTNYEAPKDYGKQVIMFAEITNNSKAAICLSAQSFPASESFYPSNVTFLGKNFPKSIDKGPDVVERFDLIQQAESTVVVVVPHNKIEGGFTWSDHVTFETGKKYRLSIDFKYLDCKLLETFKDLRIGNDIWEKTGHSLKLETEFIAP